MIEGDIAVKARGVSYQLVKGEVDELAKKLEEQGIRVLYHYLEEIHVDETQTREGPTKALMAVVTLAVSIATAGIGMTIGGALSSLVGATGATSTVITGMGAAVFTNLCTQAAQEILSCKGNIFEAAGNLSRSDRLLSVLKGMGISAVTAGLSSGLCNTLNIPTHGASSEISTNQLKSQAVKAVVNSGANAIEGQRVDEAFLHAFKSGIAGFVSTAAAKEIGVAYGDQKISFIEHKLAHALLGAGIGAAISENPLEGTLSGATGGVVAELLGEFMRAKAPKIAKDVAKDLQVKNIAITPENIAMAIPDQISGQLNLIKIITSGAALFAGLDVNVVNYTAVNALDNNFVQAIVPLVAPAVVAYIETGLIGSATVCGGAILYGVSKELSRNAEQESQRADSSQEGAANDNSSSKKGLRDDVKNSKGAKGEQKKLRELSDVPNNKTAHSTGAISAGAPPPEDWEPEGNKGKVNQKFSGNKSPNQLNKEIKTGNAPKGIERIDIGKVKGEQTHVHFKDGSALNMDGTWKHGQGMLSKAQKKWLIENEWKLP